MFADRLDVTSLLQLGETVAEMAYAGDDEFLGRRLDQRTSIDVFVRVRVVRTSAEGTSAGDLTHSTV